MTNLQHSEQFTGRLALVTGACGGLGAAVVHALIRRGATVVAADVNAQALQALAASAERIHPI